MTPAYECLDAVHALIAGIDFGLVVTRQLARGGAPVATRRAALWCVSRISGERAPKIRYELAVVVGG